MGQTQAVLKEFLADWLKWAEAGGKHAEPFLPQHGLCGSLNRWFFRRLSEPMSPEDSLRLSWLQEELASMFEKDGLDRYFPFDEGYHAFMARRGKHHLNTYRTAWIKEKLR